VAFYKKSNILNTTISSKSSSSGEGVTIKDVNSYYPFGLNHYLGINASVPVSAFSPSATYKNYKYNGKELQETGMYDYGARMYMPDIARFGTIDPRSAYTHESYSYVWNNPILFADPTGMQGELATCPTCPNTPEFQPYINDPNNTYVYDPATKTAEKEIQIQEVTLTGKAKSSDSGTNYAAYAPWLMLGTATSEIGIGELIFIVVAVAIIIDQASNHPIQPGLLIDPMMHQSPQSMNAESDADDTDVNGVNVPQEGKGGGKNAQHKNQKAKESAQGEYEKANAEYNRLKSKPNKTPQDKKDLKRAENQKNHWKKKADETGENHSQKAKGSN